MTIDEISDYLDSLGHVLVLAPTPGDGSPEISWGDRFFYYSPTGDVPNGQPFATIVTKDYPDDRGSRLDRPNTFRVNVAVRADRFAVLVGHTADERASASADPSAVDVVMPHPVYADQNWVSIVNPGHRTDLLLVDLLRSAHTSARARYERRMAMGTPEG
jgi:hypothetical protein